MECQNLFYMFLPFQMKSGLSVLDGIAGLKMSGTWEERELDTRYMYRYISNKISGNENSRQCYHFGLTQEGRTSLRIQSEKEWYEMKAWKFENSGYNEYRFQIRDLQVYCFDTGMGMVVFELSAQQSEPQYLSNLQFKLKNVSACKLILQNPQAGPEGEQPEYESFLSLAQSALKIKVREKEDVELGTFFTYANPGNERANVLTYLEVLPERYEKRKKDLFYLKRCYGSSYEYFEDGEREKEENFSLVGNITWGVTSEAAVCLACLSEKQESFLHGRLQNNFRNQYLYMYVFLLHQKYVFYQFLTRIGQGTYNDLKTLEQYHMQLCNFETDYVFSHITDVPQYQQLYDKIGQAFSLRELYQDVRGSGNPSERTSSGCGRKRAAAAGTQFKSGTGTAVIAGRVFRFGRWIRFLRCVLCPMGRCSGRAGKTDLHGDCGTDWRHCYGNAAPSAFSEKKVNEGRRKMDYLYTGWFVQAEELYRIMKEKKTNRLEKEIEYPHITLFFRPEWVDSELFGSKADITVIGYGNDGENEGLLVELKTEEETLQRAFDELQVPHITVSIGEEAKAVNTRNLKFCTIEPFCLKGVFGGMTPEGVPVFET